MGYNYEDFTKKDKGKLRALLGESANREAADFMAKTFEQYQQIMIDKPEDMRPHFWEINDKFKAFSKALSYKYDNYSNHQLPLIIAGSLSEGFFTKEDISHLSEDGQAKLMQIVAVLER